MPVPVEVFEEFEVFEAFEAFAGQVKGIKVKSITV